MADSNILQIREVQDSTSKNSPQNSNDGIEHPRQLEILHQGETDILFGAYHSITSRQLLASVPPREIADSLVDEYFSQVALAPGKSTCQISSSLMLMD
jgi:hypothetical protein